MAYLCRLMSADFSFDSFAPKLRNAMQLPLPGEEAQYRMSPMGRPKRAAAMARIPNPKLSAVLVLFYPFEGHTHMVLMLRNAYPGVHSGQVSFPGGKKEEIDASLMMTALREAEEEVGVVPNSVEVLGQLTEVYIPPSGFLVEPYVALASDRPNFQPDPSEVQQLIEVPMHEFLHPENFTSRTIPWRNGMSITVPCYVLQGHIVWGATAMMLSEMQAIIER